MELYACANLPSGLSPSTEASPISRVAIPNRLATSSGNGSIRVIQELSSHCCKLIVLSDHEDLLPFQGPGHERIPFLAALGPLTLRVDDGIDLAAKFLFRPLD